MVFSIHTYGNRHSKHVEEAAGKKSERMATLSLQCMLVIRAVQAHPAFDFIRVALVPGPSFTVHRGCCFPICDRVGDLQRLEGQARFACLLGRV
ncbi:hypothetical protein NDU88_003377 [Pleurodeles waltl]|uniref:Uncharacterized protein n=1 Tax=Pleurodeles waltl TaxID=8319 RepID=A0AAV7TNY7_PLEWA|nr:hypothetical protein NDU88_003377 [Pleurodeles waltl]